MGIGRASYLDHLRSAAVPVTGLPDKSLAGVGTQEDGGSRSRLLRWKGGMKEGIG